MGARYWLALAAFLFTTTTSAANLIIRYAETVQLQSSAAPSVSKANAGPSLSFTAYGRAFQVDLQSNARLLRSLTAQKQRQLAATPYKGTLTGIAGSWVRLTRVGAQYSGAIWDGTELYLLAPSQEVAAKLQSPIDADPNATLIFRLADTAGGFMDGTCGAMSASAAEENGSERYRALIGELKGRRYLMQAAAIQGEIEVSVLGDAQFTAMFGSNSATTMVSRMNVVDGIFAEQLGIFIIPTGLNALSGAGDPFTGTDSRGLLQQLSAYRNESPTLRATAVTHLMTGRDLDGSTIGIAYLRSVCDELYGASLSEADAGDATAPLIIAHELGHNFGAPHDNEPDSVCASTASTWLMNPYINGSNRFSTCSMQQMQPVISGAACVLPARVTDVALTVETPNLSVPVNRPFSFPVTITAIGDQPSQDVQFILGSSGGSFNAESVITPDGGSCTTGGSIHCTFGTLQPQESRRLTINMQPLPYIGTIAARAAVLSRVDRNADNNAQPLTFNVFAGSDVTIVRTSSPSSVVIDDPVEMIFDVSADGLEAAANVVATLFLSGSFVVDNVTAATGTCSTVPAYDAACQLGNIPIGQHRQIVVRGHATRTGNAVSMGAAVRADNDAESPNNHAQFTLSVTPRQDVGITLVSGSTNLIVGTPFDYVLDVRANGIETASDVTIRASIGQPFTVQQVSTSAGTCQIVNTIVSCALGALAVGETRRITLRMLAMSAGSPFISISTRATRDDSVENNSYATSVRVRHMTDVLLSGYTSTYVVEGPGQLFVQVISLGASAAGNVRVRAVLPAGFPISGATLAGGTCTTTATTAECVIASLAMDSNAHMIVAYTSAAPGSFTANFSASVSGDGDSTNNQLSTLVNLEPYIDVRVNTAASRIDAAPGQTIELPYVVTTDRRAVASATFYASGFYNMTLLSVTAADGGACVLDGSSVRCNFGDLPANASRRVQVTARVSADLNYSFTSSIYSSVSAPLDRDYSNNSSYVQVEVALRGDASLSVAEAGVIATRGQQFTLPAVTLTGLRTVENVYLEATLPASIAYSGNGMYACSFQAPILRCAAGTLTVGRTQTFSLPIMATAAGSYTIGLQLSAAGDENTQNNAGSVTVTANEPVNTSSGGGTGSGGGGGALGWQALLGLLLLYAGRLVIVRGYKHSV